VWLDTNEWNVLKQHKLHDAIHDIFTTPRRPPKLPHLWPPEDPPPELS
jgi:hypothetical protein